MKRNDEQIRKLVRSEKEVKIFIDECMNIKAQADNDEEPGLDTDRIAAFVGEDFLRAAHLPQHNYLEESDAVEEMIYTYYHELWRAYVENKMSYWNFGLSNWAVSERMRFIESKDVYKIRWLSFLNDNGMTKADFYHNFGIGVCRLFETYKMKYFRAFDKPEVPRNDIDPLSRLRYRNSIKYAVMELLDPAYLHSTNMAVGGSEPGPLA